MIRIQLVNEGRVVKQITSRVHEGVVLEQIKKFADPFDTVQILEGELSEDAKSMLQHVAKKIVPAAMAAGVAMSGAHAQGGANPNYPGLNRSVGQHISDIVSPNYKEIVRQRNYERDTQRREWDAQQNEIRRARVDAARSSGRTAMGATHQKVYDQSKVSQDGQHFIIYGMDDKVTRIPVKGTEYMAADSQRLAHYITSAGSVYYVRHPHNNGLGESTVVEGVAETLSMDQAKKVLSQYGADHFKTTSNELHFYKNGKPMSVDLVWNDDATRSVSLSQLNSATRQLKGVNVEEDIGTIGTVGSIPASGASSMTKKTQFSPTGKTTDVKFNDKGQLELNGSDELDDEAVGILQKAGVEVKEDEANLYEGVTDPELKAILDQYSEAYADYKAGGDLTDNNDFYDALVEYFSKSNEMPYDVATSGDPAEWISDKLNQLDGHQPMGEADDLEASPADQASADKNIIMQIRKAKDNEKPTTLQLGDGSTVKIDSGIASKMLQQFDRLKPDSKALMQQTLNTEESFREMLNYFNEREITESMSDVDLISNHMKPILVAEARAKKLVRGIFGK